MGVPAYTGTTHMDEADEKTVGAISTRSPTRASAGQCDVCGGPTYDRNCKIICPRCGYTRDCSDP